MFCPHKSLINHNIQQEPEPFLKIHRTGVGVVFWNSVKSEPGFFFKSQEPKPCRFRPAPKPWRHFIYVAFTACSSYLFIQFLPWIILHGICIQRDWPISETDDLSLYALSKHDVRQEEEVEEELISAHPHQAASCAQWNTKDILPRTSGLSMMGGRREGGSEWGGHGSRAMLKNV